MTKEEFLLEYMLRHKEYPNSTILYHLDDVLKGQEEQKKRELYVVHKFTEHDILECHRKLHPNVRWRSSAGKLAKLFRSLGFTTYEQLKLYNEEDFWDLSKTELSGYGRKTGRFYDEFKGYIREKYGL